MASIHRTQVTCGSTGHSTPLMWHGTFTGTNPHQHDHDVLSDNEGKTLNFPRRQQLWRDTECDTATQGNMRTCTAPHGKLKKDRLRHHIQGTMNCQCAPRWNENPWNSMGKKHRCRHPRTLDASNNRNMRCGPTNCGDFDPHTQNILLWTANFPCRRRLTRWAHSQHAEHAPPTWDCDVAA